MNARDAILSAVRASTLPQSPLPDVAQAAATFARTGEPLVEMMQRTARAGAARVLTASRDQLSDVVATAYPDAERVLSMVQSVRGNRAVPNDALEVAELDVFICEGVIGVAQDGAVWVPASRLGHRAALFLATQVVLVLRQSALVETLHDAYASIDAAAEEYGVFVAGPSKTADIEQSLVIGAHGPMALTLVLVDD